MATIISFEESLEFPVPSSLEEFRHWALSDDFPEQGRIDFIAGRLEIDMSPEDMYCHGVLKTEICAGLRRPSVEQVRRGVLFSDCMRLSSPQARLSVEPDILFVSYDSLKSGRVERIQKSGEDDRYVELEGAADLIVEIVSDSSVGKDTQRLPVAYFRAGVDEFWLVDARGNELLFSIHYRGPSRFEPAPVDTEGFQLSKVMGCRYRLERRRDPLGNWEYELQDREAP